MVSGLAAGDVFFWPFQLREEFHVSWNYVGISVKMRLKNMIHLIALLIAVALHHKP